MYLLLRFDVENDVIGNWFLRTHFEGKEEKITVENKLLILPWTERQTRNHFLAN